MVSWPTSQNVKKLRSFLGIASYYRKFVRNYGLIAKHLTDLLKKDGFVWTGVTQQAFEELKKAMVSAPILVLPDFQQPFTVETDATTR